MAVLKHFLLACFFLQIVAICTQAQTSDLNAGLLVHYPFNVDAKDTLGRFHGKVNGPKLEQKRCGNNAYYFDGGQDYIDFGNPREFNRRFSGLTVSVWLLPMEISELQLGTIVGKWAFDKLRDQFAMFINSSYKIIFAVSNRGTMEDGTFSNTALDPREWHHVVGSWRPNGEIRIYIDGELDRIGHQKGRGINTVSNVSLKAGRQVVRRNRPYKGYMDELRIYQRTLRDDEVRALYDLGKVQCERVLVKGKVKNKKTGEPVQATVVFENMVDGTIYNKVETEGDEAEFEMALPIGRRFAFFAEAENYLAENQNLSTEHMMFDDEIYAELFVVPVEVGGSIRLNNIFFDFDKATLREESFNEYLAFLRRH